MLFLLGLELADSFAILVNTFEDFEVYFASNFSEDGLNLLERDLDLGRPSLVSLFRKNDGSRNILTCFEIFRVIRI